MLTETSRAFEGLGGPLRAYKVVLKNVLLSRFSEDEDYCWADYGGVVTRLQSREAGQGQ